MPAGDAGCCSRESPPPPVEGSANAALERLLAGALHVPKSAVHVVAGARGREKTVAIEGLTQDEALRRLGTT